MRVTLLFSAWMFLFALPESRRTSWGGESTAIDEYVNREMENQRIPGLSLAVVRA